MKQILLFVLSLTVFSLNAQSLQLAKQLTGTSSGTSITMDASGNIYTIGTFLYTVDFDPSANTFNLTSNGERDIFISKLDSQGNFVWAKQIGAQYYDDIPGNIVLDSNGNILVTGSFKGTIDLDPGAGEHMVTTEGRDAFLVKLDDQGQFMWAKNWGGTTNIDENNVYSFVLDDANNIFIGGGFTGTNDLDPGAGTFSATASFYEDAYLSKLDTNGNFLWAVNFGGDAVGSRDYVKAIATDASGNIVFTGPFYGTVPTYSLVGTGIFYIKLDGAGNLIWTKMTTSSGNIIFANSLKLDATGNLYMTGNYLGTCDFDPGSGIYNLSSINGYNDVFILKLSASGDFVWAKSFGGPEGLDTGYSIELDNQGYLYTTGNYLGITDFDPGAGEFIINPVGHIDMFIQKLDTDGNFIYANTFGSAPNGDTIGKSIFSDGAGNVFFTGSFQFTTDFDPSPQVFNLVAQGSADTFILKLNGAPLGISENNLLPISIYPNPSNGNFTIDLGKEYQNITVEISNIMGQLISSEKYASAKTIQQEINTSTGIYFVKVSTANKGLSTLKILKQ